MDSTDELVMDMLVMESLTEWMQLHELLRVNQQSVNLDWSKKCWKMMEDEHGWP